MIGFEIFLFGLLVTTTLTGLVTEGVKILLNEWKVKYYANTLAGIVAVIVSAVVGMSYILVTNVALTSQIIVYAGALVLLSWLCAMVGYDKVIQAISQFKTQKED